MGSLGFSGGSGGFWECRWARGPGTERSAAAESAKAGKSGTGAIARCAGITGRRWRGRGNGATEFSCAAGRPCATL
jgi:hypothetical protein